MSTLDSIVDIDAEFFGLVAGIEELEGLQAPSWGSFWDGFAVGATLAAAIVGGIALT